MTYLKIGTYYFVTTQDCIQNGNHKKDRVAYCLKFLFNLESNKMSAIGNVQKIDSKTFPHFN